MIVSNTGRCIPYFAQRSAAVGDPVFWDYHVWLLAEHEDELYALDLDSRLPMPTPLTLYLDASFPEYPTWPKAYWPWFRPIRRDQYLAEFASDRRHMRDGERWHAPPPPWPCIGNGHILDAWREIPGVALPGKVLTVDELIEYLTASR